MNEGIAEHCALCGRSDKAGVKSDYLRCVRKHDRRLTRGYFQPRLSETDLHHLPSGESWVCTNRRACEARQKGRAR